MGLNGEPEEEGLEAVDDCPLCDYQGFLIQQSMLRHLLSS